MRYKVFDDKCHDNCNEKKCCICPRGPRGPAGDSCCCVESIRYALQTILDTDLGDVYLHYLNKTINGSFTDDTILDTDNVVNISVSTGTGYNTAVSMCNIMEIAFDTDPEPAIQSGSVNMNCTDGPECCCNKQLETAIRALLPEDVTFPYTITNIFFDLIDNRNKTYNTAIIYGICNGILWTKLGDNALGSVYTAIPLCSIVDIYKN